MLDEVQSMQSTCDLLRSEMQEIECKVKSLKNSAELTEKSKNDIQARLVLTVLFLCMLFKIIITFCKSDEAL